MIEMIKSLTERFAPGTTEIWYQTKETWDTKGFSIPDFKIDELSKTHVQLGKIYLTNLEDIFNAMQGESWSPEGEARNLISDKELVHTSMSAGDVVKIGNKAWACDNCGFKELK